VSEPSLLVERDGAVLRLTLNRPTVGNALDIPLARAFMEAVIAADEDDAVRCVLIAANGRLFCAGGDVAAFSNAGDKLPAFLKEITAYLHAAIARLTTMDKPVVVAVNGAAAGAGIGVALVGDIVIAGTSAQFALAYTGIGLSPDGATTWLLPRLVGLRKAQDLALTNRRVKSDEAERIGLVTRVVPDEALAEEALGVARQLAAGSPPALGATRRLLRESFGNTIETQMDLESRSIAALSRTAEGKEGIAAFVEKRPPNFSRE
jgi:2-(1,2-epoxy-1,2-dihydrophenyl)acetyl-CoA isomerase